jgi:hypothetical protein
MRRARVALLKPSMLVGGLGLCLPSFSRTVAVRYAEGVVRLSSCGHWMARRWRMATCTDSPRGSGEPPCPPLQRRLMMRQPLPSQRCTFQLISDHLIQKGSVFLNL